MSKGLRNKIQIKFNTYNNNSSINIIVSTVAFGMGIDQTVRCVLIFGSPNSIEEYYQMIGRAGRDGKEAESVLFFQYKSVAIGTSLLKKSELNKEVMDCKIRGLNKMANYFYTNSCRRRYILEHFGQIPKFFWCNYCDNCCEKNLIDLTDKFINVIFKKKKYSDVFTQDELELIENNNLIINKGNCIEYLISIKNWIKIVEINKYLEKGLPKKYLIKVYN
jgi:superfamily II DNA helicase RecQ